MTLPVLWHQSLMAFVQRYKNDISIEQKEDLRRLISKQSHYKITPEVINLIYTNVLLH